MTITSEKRGSLLSGVLLITVTAVLYSPLRSYDFINYDDGVYVFENAPVKAGLEWESLKWAFKATETCNWHPITWLSYMLDVELFGLDAGAHHLINLVFHIANALLLFFLLKRMTSVLWPAAFVASLFALHPLHVESVAWISERKDVLSIFLAFLAMLAWLRYTECRKLFWYFCALLLFAAGLMTKPMLVTIPFILLLLDYWPLERLKFSAGGAGNREPAKQVWALVIEKIPFFALSAISSFVTFIVQRAGGAVTTIEVFSTKVRVFNAAISYIEYIEKMFLPVGLAILYPHPGNSVATAKALACILFMATLTVLFLYTGRRRKYLTVGWLWYIGALVPVIGLVQVGNQAMADRYTYLPLIGLYIIIAWGSNELLAHWRYGKQFAWWAAGIILTVLIAVTRVQLSYWQDSLALFRHAVEVTKNNYVMHTSLGFTCRRLGLYQEAIESCRKAIAIKPDYAKAHFNLGVIFSRLGKYREAVESYTETIKIDPGHAEAHNNLGNAYANLGRYQEAIEFYKQAVKINAHYAEAFNNLASAYNQTGRYQEAVEPCKYAIKVRPDFPEAYNNLGSAYLRLNRYQEAIESFSQAIRIKADFSLPYLNLGVTYLIVGDKDSAFKQYETLKTLDAEQANKLFTILKNEKNF